MRKLLLILLLAFSLPHGAEAALAVGVHTKASSSSATTNTTTGITTQATKSSFYVFLVYDGTFVSVTDSKSNAYTTAVTEATNYSFKSRWMKCENCTGGASHTFTLTLTGSTANSIMPFEITSSTTYPLIDQAATTNADAATPFDSSGLTTTDANEILLSGIATNFTGSTEGYTAGASFTKQEEETNVSLYWPGAAATRVVSSTGTYNSSWTLTGGTAAAVSLLTVKENAGGGGTVVNPLNGLGGAAARPVTFLPRQPANDDEFLLRAIR